VKLIEGSHTSGDTDVLNDNRVMLSYGTNALQIVDVSAPHAERAKTSDEKPKLVGARTTQDTDALWKRRLNMLLHAENNLIKVIRLRKFTAIFTVASIAMFLFSLYTAPIMSPVLFYGLVALVGLGVSIYPALFIASKSNKTQRDAISRMFYKSNHEIDVSDGTVSLINRANYACVAQIHVMDRKLGQLATG